MSNIDKRVLRVLATALDGDDWHAEGNSVYGGRYDVGDNVCYDHIASCESVNGKSPHADFIAAANPATVLALLDEIAELEQGHCGTALLEREEMHAKTVGRLMEELETKDKRIAEMEAKLETEPKVPEATFESPDIPPVEPNWNDPTLREPGIWAYGFLEGQKVNLNHPPSTTVSVPDEIRLLQSEVTIWKDRWELLRELFREVADALGCDVKDNQAMLDKIEMLQDAEPVSNRDELPDGWVACNERMPGEVLAALQNVARLRRNLNDFCGDKSVIAKFLSESEEALLNAVNRHSTMLAETQQEVKP